MTLKDRRFLANFAYPFGKIGFRTRLSIAFLFFMIVIAIGTAISFIGTERSIYHLDRSRIAHEQLQLYLAVTKKSNWLLRNLYQDALTDRPSDETLNRELTAAIRADLIKLRDLTRIEVPLVGIRTAEAEEEAEELLSLIQIEGGLTGLFNAVERFEKDAPSLSAIEKNDRLEGISMRFDRDFMAHIEDILEDERGEVQRTDDAAQRLAVFLELLTTANAVIALPVAVLMLILLTRGFNSAFSQLHTGATSLTKGKMGHRIARLGDPELDQLGLAFNQMAEELSKNRAHLLKTNDSLEQIVQERTKELETANRSLGDADRLRRRFFADISHELRTPLTVIRGEAEIALRGNDKTIEDYRASLKRVVGQAEHTAQLVDDLLFMARANAGQPRLDTTSVALNELLKNVAHDFDSAAQPKQIEIECDLADDHLVVVGDRRRLRQVFNVLLDNAIRYSSECGRVRITTQRGAHGIVVTVEDNGIGIAQEDLEHIFDRYYRGGNASGHTDGTGLGLPVAKAIIDSHQGTIGIMSTLGEGATVTVTLPREGQIQSVA